MSTGLGHRPEGFAQAAGEAEQRRHRVHQPFGHRRDPEAQRHGRRDQAQRRRAGLPQQHRMADQAEDQQAAEQDHADVDGDFDPLQADEGRPGRAQLGPALPVLAAAVAEQLDGGDVGIGVDQHPGQRRQRALEPLGLASEPRHRIGHQAQIGGDPQQQRQHQPGVDRGQQPDRSEDVDRDEGQGVQHLVGGARRRAAALAHPGRDPPGQVGLEPADRLAQHMAVGAPADQGHRIGPERDVVEQLAGQREKRSHHQHQRGDGDQLGPARRPQLCRRGRGQDVDQPAGIADQPDLQRGGEHGQRQAGRHHPAQRLQVSNQERPQAGRRRAVVIGLERIDEVGEPTKHAALHRAGTGSSDGSGRPRGPERHRASALLLRAAPFHRSISRHASLAGLIARGRGCVNRGRWRPPG